MAQCDHLDMIKYFFNLSQVMNLFKLSDGDGLKGFLSGGSDLNEFIMFDQEHV